MSEIPASLRASFREKLIFTKEYEFSDSFVNSIVAQLEGQDRFVAAGNLLLLYDRKEEALESYKKGMPKGGREAFLGAGRLARTLGKKMEGMIYLAKGGCRDELENILKRDNYSKRDKEICLRHMEKVLLNSPNTQKPCFREGNLSSAAYLANQIGLHEKAIEYYLISGEYDFARDIAKKQGLVEFMFSKVKERAKVTLDSYLKHIGENENIPVIRQFKLDYMKVSYFRKLSARAYSEYVSSLNLKEDSFELNKEAIKIILENPDFMPLLKRIEDKKKNTGHLPEGCPLSGKKYEFEPEKLFIYTPFYDIDIHSVYYMFQEVDMYKEGAPLFEGIDDEKAMSLHEQAGNLEKALELCEKINYSFWKAKDLSEKLGKEEKAAVYGMVRE